MTQTTERVYILGGTGHIGSKVARDLIANHIPVTIFARDPNKVSSLFPNSGDLVNVVQGDYSDLTPLKNSLPGHTRLFLLVKDLKDLTKHKIAIATLAYEAGVKQVVDVSTLLTTFQWRASYIAHIHYVAEKKIEEIPGRGAFVTLRPGTFMSNFYNFDPPQGNVLTGVAPGDARQNWISPTDIGALAAIILLEPIEKHGDAVYEMIGDVATPEEQAAVLSRVLGRQITYKRISEVERYNHLQKLGYPSHEVIYDLVQYLEPPNLEVTGKLQILLGREPEKLEAFLAAHKDKFA
ncbi:hypothetical protein EC973_000039 [Apophysomyces ossiformis]|uniref:NmrA-like domain-containing protein n=1 Tax=Apophysomyces ossiformis TaxID=679940 RepID=A0A8H7BZD0_9FUNG|nr:hypothetical protein EC973_000039 [Apophysomyces ossiformis]